MFVIFYYLNRTIIFNFDLINQNENLKYEDIILFKISSIINYTLFEVKFHIF